jgi:hypothetical protein
MGKRKKGPNGENPKLGPPDHFSGFKLAFLVSKAALYQQALDTKNAATITAFYNKVTLDFIAKYGEEEPFNKEVAVDPPDSEDIDEGDDEIGIPPQSKEEAAASAVLFGKLRTVSGKYSKNTTPSDLFHRS